MAAGLFKNTGLDSEGSLLRKHSVAKRGELLAQRKAIPFIGDPARRESHKPFHEYRRWTRPGHIIEERRSRRRAASILLPPDHGFGVSSPSPKSCPIRLHRLSGSSVCGEPFCPCKARSMIW